METINIKIDARVVEDFILFYEENGIKEAGLSLDEFMSDTLNRVLVHDLLQLGQARVEEPSRA